MIDIKELPDSTYDKSCIRLLGFKHQDKHPFDNDHDQSFLRRFFEKYLQEEKEHFLMKQLKVSRDILI